MEDLPDGGLRLAIPVSDFREVRMKVLQFGADVEVIAQEALREDIRNEIEKMTRIYLEVGH